MKPQLNPTTCSPELSRLISAAVVNKAFCRLLLRDPATALESGYLGESFRLPPNERALVLSIKASSLADFVSVLLYGAALEEDFTGLLPTTAAEEATVFVQPVGSAVRTLAKENGQEIAEVWTTSLKPALEPA